MITFIKKIEMCEAQKVHTIPCLARQEAMVYHADWTELPTIDFSEVETTDDVDRGQRQYETRVTGLMCERIVLPAHPVVFRLTDIYNNLFLVGVPELAPPYPLVTQVDKAPGKPTDSCLCKLEIRLKSVYPIMKIV